MTSGRNGHRKARASGGARTGQGGAKSDRNPLAELAGTGQGGAKSDSNPLAELAGTGQCGAGTDESRMTSGGIRRRKSRITSGEKDKKDEFGTEFVVMGSSMIINKNTIQQCK